MTPRRGEEPLRWRELYCPYGHVKWVERWDGCGVRHLGRLNDRPLSDEQLQALLDELDYDVKMAAIARGERPPGVHLGEGASGPRRPRPRRLAQDHLMLDSDWEQAIRRSISR